MRIGRFMLLAAASMFVATTLSQHAAAQTRIVMAGRRPAAQPICISPRLRRCSTSTFPAWKRARAPAAQWRTSRCSSAAASRSPLPARVMRKRCSARKGSRRQEYGRCSRCSTFRSISSCRKIHLFTSFADLKGKRVSVGIRAGGEANLFLRLIELYGMKESDFHLEFLGKGEGTNAYKDGAVDALTFLCPLPCPVVTELATHPRGVRLVPFCDEEVAKIRDKYDVVQPLYDREELVYQCA